MTADERKSKREDSVEEGATTTRKLTKLELTEKLTNLGVMTKGKLSDLQRAVMEQGIPLEETTVKVKEGWAQKQKGLLQVLWERGFINTSKNVKSYYTINGTKNTFGIIQTDMSLKYLMAACTDFEEEETLLQSMGRKMGVLVDRMPKCHCELAGEGIKYSWGCSKNFYQEIPLSDK